MAMHKQLPFFLAVILAFVLVPRVYSAAAERSVGLTGAIKLAMENNHEVRSSRYSLFAQKEGVGIARSYLLPRLSFEERATRTNNPPGVFMMKLNQERFAQTDFDIFSLNNPRPTSDLQTLFTIEQPIFVGKSLIGLSMAKKEYSAQNESYIRKKEEIAFQVSQAYLKARSAKAHLTVTEKALEDAREHARIAESRYKNGLGLYSDVLRTKTSVIEAEQRIVSARKNVAVSKRMLGLVLGVPESIDTAEEEIDIPLKDADYYSTASLSRRDVKALQLRYENARNSIRLAESAYLPSLGVGGAYQFNDRNRIFGSEGESWRISAALRWDLFDGTSREYERSKALHKAAEAEEQLKGLKELVSFKIHEAYLAVEEAEKNVELSQSALNAAEEGKKLVKSRFENSLSPVVDLLDVQLSLDHARANVVTKQNECQLAIINLAYESGTILKDLNAE